MALDFKLGSVLWWGSIAIGGAGGLQLLPYIFFFYILCVVGNFNMGFQSRLDD